MHRVLIVGIILLAIVFIMYSPIESFRGWAESRVYPGLFSKTVYPYYPNYLGGYDYQHQGDYWYIPAHESLKAMVARPYNDDCYVPERVNLDCARKELRQGSAYNVAIASCTIPESISESCASGKYPFYY